MLLPAQKRWLVANPIPLEYQTSLTGFSPVLQQILYNRGYTSFEAATSFLHAETPAGCEPENLLGMSEAVERIAFALSSGQRIAIYGDYDVDGVTATALLTLVLQALGAEVEGYIPNRFEEGYGLNIEALKTLYERGTRLVITVDCGIRSPEEAAFAQELGIDLIITDHHQPSDELPPALAIINPKQSEDNYPDKDLAGVGIAYKLSCALLTKDKSTVTSLPDCQEYLDLVALGTVADIAPLVGENRALVRTGLRILNQQKRQGIRSLLGASGIQNKSISAEDIGFILGPRLNAAGRLDSALASLELLVSQDVSSTGYLSQLLNDQNRERQQITREIQAHAEQIALAQEPDPLLLFASDPGFNPGIVGLAASKLLEKYYRPAIVAHQGDEFTRGSCRSISEFHITQALDECADILVHHGGHAAAAGFTIRNENLPELIDRLKIIAAEQLGGKNLRPGIAGDVELPLAELKPEILADLANLQPTGHKNPMATFVSRHLTVRRKRALGQESAHLKLTVSDGQITYDAIAFRQGHLVESLPTTIDMLYTFEINEYNGRVSLQLNVKDLKPSGTPD